ncbi:hypothetical protein PAL_GLEAN10022813 [Pteropus alecto]|uniref:Uncharacterized protein n=1 Tax=Pteropus alecto TaxID=9402 RepID=L5K5A8_PTEAL|nr:hypothetical protein PAL_GLEAN10022813 [Pteropus alecto]
MDAVGTAMGAACSPEPGLAVEGSAPCPPALPPWEPRRGGSRWPSISAGEGGRLGCHDDRPWRLSGSRPPKAGVSCSVWQGPDGQSRATSGKAGATPEDEGCSGWT